MSARRRLTILAVGAALACAVVVHSTGGQAEQGGTAGERGGTVDQLVAALLSRLDGALPREELAACDLALVIRKQAEVSSRLLRAVREQLLGQLNPKGLRSVATLPAEQSARQRQQRAEQAGFELLLDLELLLTEGYLELRGPLVRTDRLLWRDTVQPERGSLSQLYARARMDAELRSLQGMARATGLRFAPRAYPLAEQPVLALAVTDLDGEGINELVLLHAQALQVLRYKGSSDGFVVAYEAKLVPPWAGQRVRRPLGYLLARELDRPGKGELLARTSEMEQAAILQLEGPGLRRRQGPGGYPVGILHGNQSQREELRVEGLPGQDLLDAARAASVLSRWFPATLKREWPTALYNLVVAELTPPGGGGRLRYLGVVDASGRFQLYLEGRASVAVTMQGSGVAFDLVDLDDDGNLELATTGSGGPEARDSLAVHRLTGGGLPRQLWQSSALEGLVTALGHGDIDNDGTIELLAALQDARGRVQLLVLN